MRFDPQSDSRTHVERIIGERFPQETAMDNAQFEEFKALFAPISMLALEDMRNRPPLMPAMDAGYPLPVAVKPEPEPELPYAPPSRLPDDPSTGGSREDLGDI